MKETYRLKSWPGGSGYGLKRHLRQLLYPRQPVDATRFALDLWAVSPRQFD
jgi:hypothetical protein